MIDSVIDQEYGESFKNKPGYEGLQEKLMSTILGNEVSREAVEDFFELLLIANKLNDEEDDDEESSGGDQEEYSEDEEYEDEDYEEE